MLSLGLWVPIATLQAQGPLQCPGIGGDPAPCIGSDESDLLNGSDVADEFDAGDGDDIVFGNGGDDTGTLGDGGDFFFDGPGNDGIGVEGAIGGGDGDDRYLIGPDDGTAGGEQNFNGQAGNDTFTILPGLSFGVETPLPGAVPGFGDDAAGGDGGTDIVCGDGDDTVQFFNGPSTFDNVPPRDLIVFDPITGGAFGIDSSCERVHGLAEPPIVLPG